MDISPLMVFGIAFGLGIKHAMEPDHVIAVSTIASQTKKLRHASLSGLFWGIGHSLTIFVSSMVLILLKSEIPPHWAMTLEFMVGVMLVVLGVRSWFARAQSGIEAGQQAENEKAGKLLRSAYIRSTVIGFIHGMAGSAAMVLLTLSTVRDVGTEVIYLIMFGMGTIAGMMICSTIVGVPFLFVKEALQRILMRFTGVLSTVFGFYWMYKLGVTEGLFKLWL